MQQRQVRVDAIPPATPSATPKCPALAGLCTETGQHFDHRARPVAVPAPRGIGGQAAIEAELMALDDGTDREPEPIASFAWGGETAELTPAELLELAQQVEQFADGLRTLADQLTTAQQQYRDTRV